MKLKFNNRNNTEMISRVWEPTYRGWSRSFKKMLEIPGWSRCSQTWTAVSSCQLHSCWAINRYCGLKSPPLDVVACRSRRSWCRSGGLCALRRMAIGCRAGNVSETDAGVAILCYSDVTRLALHSKYHRRCWTLMMADISVYLSNVDQLSYWI